MTIQEHFDQIGILFDSFNKQRSEIESMENHFHDMTYNPTKYHGISCPIGLHSLALLRISNERYFAQLIYNEIESLYRSILLDLDSSSGSCSLYNIRIEKFLKTFLNNTSEGARIKVNSNTNHLISTILGSNSFNTGTSPEYSILNSIIEWRGANAHFSFGSKSIDLTYFKLQFDSRKQLLIDLHDKLLRYLTALKVVGFNTDFDAFV